MLVEPSSDETAPAAYPVLERVKQRRWKTALVLLLLVVCEAASCRAYAEDSSLRAGLAAIGCGLLIPLAVIGLIWPVEILLDAQGFTMICGWKRKLIRRVWADIEDIFLWHAGHGVKVIGCRYFENRRPNPNPVKFYGPLKVDFNIPNVWGLSPQVVVDKLNGYRLRAVR